jgi:hypothetical protein
MFSFPANVNKLKPASTHNSSSLIVLFIFITVFRLSLINGRSNKEVVCFFFHGVHVTA